VFLWSLLFSRASYRRRMELSGSHRFTVSQFKFLRHRGRGSEHGRRDQGHREVPDKRMTQHAKLVRGSAPCFFRSLHCMSPPYEYSPPFGANYLQRDFGLSSTFFTTGGRASKYRLLPTMQPLRVPPDANRSMEKLAQAGFGQHFRARPVADDTSVAHENNSLNFRQNVG
jgi:hypothetical protein